MNHLLLQPPVICFHFLHETNGAQAATYLARETIKKLIRKVSQKQKTRQEEATRPRIIIYHC